MKKNLKDKTKKVYVCPYCKHTFEQYVGEFGQYNPHHSRNKTSSQVSCPKCKNFLKTWEMGEEV